MFDVILEALKAVWDWLLSVIVGCASWCLAKVTSIIPGLDSSQLQNAKGTIAYAVSAANAWVPLDLIITLAAAYVTFVVVYLGVKIAIKLIP